MYVKTRSPLHLYCHWVWGIYNWGVMGFNAYAESHQLDLVRWYNIPTSWAIYKYNRYILWSIFSCWCQWIDVWHEYNRVYKYFRVEPKVEYSPVPQFKCKELSQEKWHQFDSHMFTYCWLQQGCFISVPHFSPILKVPLRSYN